MTESVRLLLVDDNDVYRSSLELLLALEPGLTVAGSVATAGAALELVAGGGFDVVLTDLRLPGLSGVELAHTLGAGAVGVVCLTAEAGAEERAAAAAAGAAVLEKGVPLAEIAAAVRRAAGAPGAQ